MRLIRGYSDAVRTVSCRIRRTGSFICGKIDGVCSDAAEQTSVLVAVLWAEMRGGTANCSVCVDDNVIGCPIVGHPQMLLALNRPSFQKYINTVVPGGTAIYDSSMIPDKTNRSDITCIPIPAHRMAEEQGLSGLANMILVGRMLRENPFVTLSEMGQTLREMIPASKKHLLEPNLQALELGYTFVG